jgi:hypothetical protein
MKRSINAVINKSFALKKMQAGKPIIIDFQKANFQKIYFPRSNRRDWKNWHWQIKNSITGLDRLDEIL